MVINFTLAGEKSGIPFLSKSGTILSLKSMVTLKSCVTYDPPSNTLTFEILSPYGSDISMLLDNV